MVNPLLSIIVPVYNVEQYLRKCIDSILSQTYTDFELILVDDGSTDNSGKICDEYALKDNRIIVLHKENGGVSSARNCGLDIAKGDYIAFADSDDYVDSKWLDNFISVLKDEDIIVQGFVGVYDNKEVRSYIPENNCGTNTKLIEKLIDNGVYGYLFVKLFNRSIIEVNHIRFDCNSTFREDEQFISRYMEYVTKLSISSEWGYFYYIPSADKNYKGNPYYSLLPIFKSLDKIYDFKIPKLIVEKHFVNIRDSIVVSILNRKIVDKYIINLYTRMCKVIGRDKAIDFVLRHPNNVFSYLVITLFRKLNIRK